MTTEYLFPVRVLAAVTATPGNNIFPLRTLPEISNAAAGDFGNGISAVLDWSKYAFINPDLTLYIERPPAGEWICLDASTRIAPGGIGGAESVLYDQRGRVGRAIQALLVAPR